MSKLSAAVGSRWDVAGANSPQYTVRAVAQRLGLPTATLRSWNQRYGIGPSGHSPGRHRLYSNADIAVVELMQDLVGKGVNPGSAARAALESAIPQRADSASLLTAAFDLDTAVGSRLLDRHIRHFGVLETWEGLVRPAFAAIGARQNDGDRCIDVEHALSWLVAGALQRVSNAPSDAPHSLILACTAGESHTLALEALRAALDERGHGALMLGADVPGSALLDAIERSPGRDITIVLWSSHRDTADVAAAKAVVAAGAHLYIGGPGWVSAKVPRKAKRVAALHDALQCLT
jgi:MerR family transcriptional regulator, light-induced transcriptional regulator